jgi:divalent metal cation (Fe/Co/Zn/Cd) transporter
VALALTTGWLVLDPLVALAVAAHIIWTGIRLMRRSVTGLLDGAIPQTDRAEIDKLFAEYSRRYGISFHALLTRRAAARRFITFHMLVPDQWSVAQAHRLSEEIEERVRELVDGAHVTTHIEPISDPASYDDQKLDR